MQLCAKAQCSGAHMNGTFQQYCLAQAAQVARIPKDVPLDGIAPGMWTDQVW
jgi:propanol-preferring alcohol dehydrogenase